MRCFRRAQFQPSTSSSNFARNCSGDGASELPGVLFSMPLQCAPGAYICNGLFLCRRPATVSMAVPSELMTSPELNLVAELANRLAERTLDALEHGRLTTEEFRESPDVALILDAATLLQAAGAEFPRGIVRLAQKAGEQTQI